MVFFYLLEDEKKGEQVDQSGYSGPGGLVSQVEDVAEMVKKVKLDDM